MTLKVYRVIKQMRSLRLTAHTFHSLGVTKYTSTDAN